MAKIQNISEIHPTLGFTEFDIIGYCFKKIVFHIVCLKQFAIGVMMQS